MAKPTFKAFCLVCCGGGKVLVEGGIQACEREATNHGNVYQHSVTILRPKRDVEGESNVLVAPGWQVMTPEQVMKEQAEEIAQLRADKKELTDIVYDQQDEINRLMNDAKHGGQTIGEWSREQAVKAETRNLEQVNAALLAAIKDLVSAAEASSAGLDEWHIPTSQARAAIRAAKGESNG